MESITTEVLDDKQRRDARGRRIVGKERQAELLSAYDASDLSQREFARREGINFHTFVEWLQRRRRAAGGKPPPRFQELSLPFVPKTSGTVAAASLEVELADGTSIRGNNVEEIARLLRLIRC
ncbi:MAG: hypothetical protein RLZZ15_3099 [Verrucomicrobiota bacterium]